LILNNYVNSVLYSTNGKICLTSFTKAFFENLFAIIMTFMNGNIIKNETREVKKQGERKKRY
jgi:hypothetical protein